MNMTRWVWAFVVVAVAAAGGGCTPNTVDNPDYQAWITLKPGSYVTFEGHQIDGKKTEPLRLTDTLVAKDAERVIIDRKIMLTGADAKGQSAVARRVEWARIRPEDHLRTHPWARIKDKDPEQVVIDGKPHLCGVREVQARGKIEGITPQEQDLWVLAHVSPQVPGGIAKVHFKAKTLFHTVEVKGQVVKYEAKRD